MRVSSGKYNMLLASAVVVVISIILCVVFYQSYQAKNEIYSALNNKLDRESKRFSILDDTTQLVAEYEKQFNQYMPIKRFETENRLYWLDSLDNIRIKHKIPELSYSIDTQKKYDYSDSVIKDRGLNVFVSNIKLKMKLMHEADLLAVVNSLKQIKESIHIVSSCQLKRIGVIKKNVQSSSGPNIDAVCNVRWFTFKV